MHHYGPTLMGALVSAALFPFVLLAAVATALVLGYALWCSARNGQKGWFIALVIFHGIGFILGGIYLIWFRDNKRAHHSHTHADSSAA